MSDKSEKKYVTKRGYKAILECIAFFGVACVAISLIIAICFEGSSTTYMVFRTVGDAISYILAMILAAFWVRRQKHIAWLICYVVFVVVIIVLYILGVVIK